MTAIGPVRKRGAALAGRGPRMVVVILYADKPGSMTNTYYHTRLRSSVPQQRWREEADARESKRRAVEAASRRRSQVVQQLQQQSATQGEDRSGRKALRRFLRFDPCHWT